MSEFSVIKKIQKSLIIQINNEREYSDLVIQRTNRPGIFIREENIKKGGLEVVHLVEWKQI